jgi:hypothetical protein
MNKTGLLLLAALTWAGPAAAQRLYFANGEVEWSEVTLNGTNLQKRVKTSDGREAITSIPASTVTRVDWPYPEELAGALQDILAKKYDDGLKKANAVREIHRNWKDKPGSWYIQSTLYAAECYIRKGDATESDKILTELRNSQLTGFNQQALSFVQAVEELARKKPGPALAKVAPALVSDDSALAARASLLKGEIKFEQGEFRESLDSFLQIPVFYGAQGALMAPAELGAARALHKLGRLQDSSSALARLSERYKGTAEAAEADKLKIEIDSALAGGGAPPPAEKPAEDTESK